jgi:hypothetical protein
MANTAPTLSYVVQCFLIISFLIYGASCFVSEKNRREFARYKLSHLRKTTGTLQILACGGLLCGFFIPWLVPITSLGLSMMMLSALFVRWRIKDSALASAPALIYLLLSLFLLFSSMNNLNPVLLTLHL